jgi:hypothetical protein
VDSDGCRAPRSSSAKGSARFRPRGEPDLERTSSARRSQPRFEPATHGVEIRYPRRTSARIGGEWGRAQIRERGGAMRCGCSVLCTPMVGSRGVWTSRSKSQGIKAVKERLGGWNIRHSLRPLLSVPAGGRRSAPHRSLAKGACAYGNWRWVETLHNAAGESILVRAQ